MSAPDGSSTLGPAQEGGQLTLCLNRGAKMTHVKTERVKAEPLDDGAKKARTCASHDSADGPSKDVVPTCASRDSAARPSKDVVPSAKAQYNKFSYRLRAAPKHVRDRWETVKRSSDVASKDSFMASVMSVVRGDYSNVYPAPHR